MSILSLVAYPPEEAYIPLAGCPFNLCREIQAMKPTKTLLSGLVSFAVLSTPALSAEPITTKVIHDPRITHLNVRVGEIVNLESECYLPDNTQQPLTLDRSLVPFQIPKGHSLVVTDIIALPFCGGHFVPEGRWFAVLEGQQGLRGFEIGFRGDSTVHYALNGGIAYSSDNVPVIRVIESPNPSTARLEVQVLGYFVRGNALPVPR